LALMHEARFTVPVSGRAAFVLARLLDPRELERRLSDAGFRGSPRAEALREEVMTAVALLHERGRAWHEAERIGACFTTTLNETPAVSSGGTSAVMSSTRITQDEAARYLGVTRQWVGVLRRRGDLSGAQDESPGARRRWTYDLEEVVMRANDRRADQCPTE
jgi:hypothetical protein